MNEPEPTTLERLQNVAGDIIRNPLPPPGNCPHCTRPLNRKYSKCYNCKKIYLDHLPNAAGFVTYAAKNKEIGKRLYKYKNPKPSQDSQETVRLLLEYGIEHLECAEKIVGADITHYAFVASTKNRVSPMKNLINLSVPEIKLTYNAEIKPARSTVQSNLFHSDSVPSDSHVLLLEDTWVSGNRPVSATAALREAGASHITLLCAARWIGPKAFPKDPQEYEPHCPFTRTTCP